MKKHLRHFFALGTIVALLASFAPATAGGVAVTLTPSSSSSATEEVTISWTASGEYVTGTTITFTTLDPFASITDSCGGSPDLDLNDDATPNGTFGQATTTASATFTVSTSTGFGGSTDLTMALCLVLELPTGAENYSISLLSSNPVDFGSALFYANGGNTVAVSATVPATLSFAIRNAADSSTINTCALGTLGTTATSTCSYRLRIATNASNGFSSTVAANQDFGTGSATMTNVVDDGTDPVAGTELYGFGYIVAATEGGRNTSTQAYTEAAVENAPTGFTFNADPTAVPTSSKSFISYNAPFKTGAASSPTSTTYVEHAASIHDATPAGAYSQTVTYTVTGSY